MRFKAWFRALGAMVGTAAAMMMAGCAHPLSMAPEATPISSVPNKIEKSVAYVISPADMTKEVQTPGGGGDKVKYQPYKDLDAALYQAFSAVFADVTKVAAVTEAKGVSYVIEPIITTTSSSDSLMAWPPTRFSVNLVCKVKDANGQLLTEVRGVGDGEATFSEVVKDYSMSARRASRSAVDNLVKALAADPELRR